METESPVDVLTEIEHLATTTVAALERHRSAATRMSKRGALRAVYLRQVAEHFQALVREALVKPLEE